MEFFEGDKLVLKATAFNPENPSQVLYTQGTVVNVVKTSPDGLVLRFPDGECFFSDRQDTLSAYNRVSEAGAMTFVKTIEGYGSPPKQFDAYLPPEAKWTRNYRWKVTIELEDRGDKEYMCSACKVELKGTYEDGILTKCHKCDTMMVPQKPGDFI